MSKTKNHEDNLESAREQARAEMANLARLYSIRSKDSPNFRIAFAEIEKQLLENKLACKLSS